MIRTTCAAVLFDLDGTVLDTAPDLLLALNSLRRRRVLPDLALPGFRGQVSRGAGAMLTVGLPGFAEADQATRSALVEEFLGAYQAQIHQDTVLFPGMAETLNELERLGVALAIVTNKPLALARPLLAAMNLTTRFPVLLGGDSLPERKPHPQPVLTACAALGVAPARALFVGDDARDVEAGRAAGCRTVAVTWGYVEGQTLADWGADAIIDHPRELLSLVRP